MTPCVVASHLYARDALGALAGLDLTLPKGAVGALIGSCRDGTSVLASVLSGAVLPSSGSLTVDNQAPMSSPAIRSKIGALLHDPILPNLGRVRDLLAYARLIRGEAPRDSWLPALCIDQLLDLKVGSLDRRQRRSVAMALAFAIESPSLIVLHEPLAELVGCSSTAIRMLLQQRASQGVTVLILTASAQDGSELADDVATISHGRIDRAIGAPDVEEFCPGTSTQLLVWSTNPRLLASSLAIDPTIQSVSLSQDNPAAPVVLRAKDADSCGKAVAELARKNDIKITAMRISLPSTEEISAASAGLALGAKYQAALHHAADARNGYPK